MVTMGKGANVITNENTEKIAVAAEKGREMESELKIQGIDKLIAALNENTKAAKVTPALTPAPAGAAAPIVGSVVMQLNEREFGRAVDKHIEEKYDFKQD